MYHLVVKNPFAGRAKGEVITDPETIAAIIASEHEGHVIKINAPAAVATETPPAPVAS